MYSEKPFFHIKRCPEALKNFIHHLFYGKMQLTLWNMKKTFKK